MAYKHMSRRPRFKGVYRIPLGYEPIELYAVRHKLDLTKLYLGKDKGLITMSLWHTSPNVQVWIIDRETPPPAFAKPARGRKPYTLEPEQKHRIKTARPLMAQEPKYTVGKLAKDLGVEEAACLDWLKNRLGLAATLLGKGKRGTDLGRDRYELLLEIGRTSLTGRSRYAD